MFKLKCLLLILIPVISLAQEKKLEIDFNAPKSSLGTYDTYSFVNKGKDRVCILAVNDNDVKGYILNQDYVLLKEFHAGKQPLSQVVIGGFFAGDKIHFLLARDENDDEITHFIYDPATDLNNFISADLQIKKSMYMGGLSLGDQFLFVSVKKKEDKISVYRFSGKQTHEVLQFDYPASGIEEESLYKAFSKESGLSRSSEIAYVNGWEVPSIEKAKDYCKMYYLNDSLIITIDKSVNKTQVIELDLKTQKTTGRVIKRTFAMCSDVKDPAFLSQSSFLLDRYLYSVVCCSNALQLSVHNFYDGKIIRQYTTAKDEEISFRNTDILQEGSASFSGAERKIEKTKQLLRKMTNGRALIIARNLKPSIVELTIGSYTVTSSGGGGMWMGGAGPGATSIYVSTGGFSRGWVKSARFKTLLKVSDFEKTNDEIEKPLDEIIDTYTKNIKIPEGCEGVYPVNEKLAYYYLDRKALKLVVSSL